MSSAPCKRPSEKASLSQKTLSGFLWSFSQTGVTRLIAISSQLVLANLLMPGDFGLIAIVYAVQGFAQLLEKHGIGRVLISRQNELTELASPAFWVFMTLSLGSAVAVTAASSIVSEHYADPRLRDLLLLIAFTIPFNSITEFAKIRFSIDLNFRTIALLDLWILGGTSLLVIFFAWSGLGVYSFVLPGVIIGPIAAVAAFRMAKLPVRFHARFAEWPGFFKVSGVFFFVALIEVVIERGDKLILAESQSPEMVGHYAIAYSLSLQTFTLLMTTVSAVLFAAMSSIDDEAKKARVYRDSSKLLLYATTPVCLLVAILSEHFVPALLGEKWIPAIPAIQILSIGFILRPLGAVATSYQHSMQRFMPSLYISIIRVSVFLVLAFWAADKGLGWFAVAAASPFIVGPVLNALWVSGFSWHGLKQLLSTILPPLCVAVAATLPVYWASTSGTATTLPTSFELGMSVLLSALVVFTGLRTFDRPLHDQALNMVRARIFKGR